MWVPRTLVAGCWCMVPCWCMVIYIQYITFIKQNTFSTVHCITFLSLYHSHFITLSFDLNHLSRAGNSLIWFPSKSLVFCPKMSEWAIRSKKWAIHSFAHFWWAKWAIRSHRSFPLSDLSESLMVAHFLWAKWAIRSHRSFDLSEMSDSLTSLTKKEEMSENERKWAIRSFFNNFCF